MLFKSRCNADSGYVGGFCGNFVALLIVKNAYSTGEVTGPVYDGGFVGGAGSVMTENTYWDTDSSFHANAVGGWQGAPGTPDITPKTTLEMKTLTMVDALNDGSGPWMLDPNVNDGYPSFISGNVSLPIEELTAVKISVYPNTFTDELQMDTDDVLERYVIYQMSGKIVQTRNP